MLNLLPYCRENRLIYIETSDKQPHSSPKFLDHADLTPAEARGKGGGIRDRADSKFDELKGLAESNTGIKQAVNNLLEEKLSVSTRINGLLNALKSGEPIKYNGIVYSRNGNTATCNTGEEKFVLRASDSEINPRLIEAIKFGQGLRQPRSGGPVDPSTFNWVE